MALQVQRNVDNTTVIKISGRFDFSCHNEFRQAYASHPAGGSIVVDMADASYLDSAALGMLLLLRDHATATGSPVLLSNCQGQPREVLRIANFDRLFKIR
jgi:HptB-dependent secretion and biofilm anti anti-sigma factor